MRSSSVMSASFFENVMKLIIDYFKLIVRQPLLLTRSYLAQILLPLPNPFKPLTTIRKPKSSTNLITAVGSLYPAYALNPLAAQPRQRSPGCSMILAEEEYWQNPGKIWDWEQRLARNVPTPTHSYERRMRGLLAPFVHHYNASRML